MTMGFRRIRKWRPSCVRSAAGHARRAPGGGGGASFPSSKASKGRRHGRSREHRRAPLAGRAARLFLHARTSWDSRADTSESALRISQRHSECRSPSASSHDIGWTRKIRRRRTTNRSSRSFTTSTPAHRNRSDSRSSTARARRIRRSKPPDIAIRPGADAAGRRQRSTSARRDQLVATDRPAAGAQGTASRIREPAKPSRA